MSKDRSESGANIRNYSEVNKGGYSRTAARTLFPAGKSYGLPTLILNPLIPEQAVTPKSKSTNVTPSANKKYSKQSDRNFLIGTAAAALLLVISIVGFHNFNNISGAEKIVSQNSFEQIDESRLNHSPESILVREGIGPEYIPGKVEKEVATCALIVGSFSRKSNAIEMQQKVLAAGYELHTEEFHEFYRVGVSIDCSDVKGATFQEIEEVIGVDPWLRISF